MIACLGSAWIQHTDASREMAQDIVRAWEIAGYSQKTAALEMGLTEPQLSRQMAGTDQVSLWRLAALSPAFMLALLGLRASRLGAALLTGEQVALLRGAAQIGPKRMAVMVGESSEERRRA